MTAVPASDRAPRRPAPDRAAGRAADPRDLPERPGRIDLRRAAVRVRPARGLRQPLQVVRHPARLQPGRADAPRRRCWRRPSPSTARWSRSPAANRSCSRTCFPLMTELCDAGQDGAARNERRPRRRPGRSARPRHHGPEVPRQRRVRPATTGRTSTGSSRPTRSSSSSPRAATGTGPREPSASTGSTSGSRSWSSAVFGTVAAAGAGRVAAGVRAARCGCSFRCTSTSGTRPPAASDGPAFSSPPAPTEPPPRGYPG